MTLTPEEAAVYPERQLEAAARLNTAIEVEQFTRHLPPGNAARESALEEWRWARAVAAEWDEDG